MILYDPTADEEVALPDDYLWTDEFAWTGVEDVVAYSISSPAALVIEPTELAAGRPITLIPPSANFWIDRYTAENLLAMATRPGRVLQLTMRENTAYEVTRQVMFRHDEGAIEVTPIFHVEPPADTDPKAVIIRLREVS